MAVAGPPVSLYPPSTSSLQDMQPGPAAAAGPLLSGITWWGVTDPRVSQAVGLSTVADAVKNLVYFSREEGFWGDQDVSFQRGVKEQSLLKKEKGERKHSLVSLCKN